MDCKYGEKCQHAHTYAEMRKPNEDVYLYLIRMGKDPNDYEMIGSQKKIVRSPTKVVEIDPALRILTERKQRKASTLLEDLPNPFEHIEATKDSQISEF